MKIEKWWISYSIEVWMLIKMVENIYIISVFDCIVIVFAVGSLLKVEPHWYAWQHVGICALIWPLSVLYGSKISACLHL